MRFSRLFGRGCLALFTTMAFLPFGTFGQASSQGNGKLLNGYICLVDDAGVMKDYSFSLSPNLRQIAPGENPKGGMAFVSNSLGYGRMASREAPLICGNPCSWDIAGIGSLIFAASVEKKGDSPGIDDYIAFRLVSLLTEKACGEKTPANFSYSRSMSFKNYQEYAKWIVLLSEIELNFPKCKLAGGLQNDDLIEKISVASVQLVKSKYSPGIVEEFIAIAQKFAESPDDYQLQKKYVSIREDVLALAEQMRIECNQSVKEIDAYLSRSPVSLQGMARQASSQPVMDTTLSDKIAACISKDGTGDVVFSENFKAEKAEDSKLAYEYTIDIKVKYPEYDEAKKAAVDNEFVFKKTYKGKATIIEIDPADLSSGTSSSASASSPASMPAKQ